MAKVVVVNNRPNVTTVRGSGADAVRLMPGRNEVRADLWEKITAASPLVTGLVQAGNITVTDAPELKGASAKERAKAVAEVFDMVVLRKLLEDQSKQVRDAAQAQIDLIESQGADDSDADG